MPFIEANPKFIFLYNHSTGCKGDHTTFNIGVGSCATYDMYTGWNGAWCRMDCGLHGGEYLCASDVCPECGC